jgi:hypothetical protein
LFIQKPQLIRGFGPLKTDSSTGEAMIVILSLSRTITLLKAYHGLDPAMTDEEVGVRIDFYSRDFFADIASDYGVAFAGLIENQSTIGVFRFDISRTKGGATVDWEKLIGGLAKLQPVAVSVERSDIWVICDALVGTALNKSWHEVEPLLQRLSLEELRPRFEEICLRTVWSQPQELQQYEYQDELREIQADALLDEAGIKNPTAKHREIEEYRRAEIEAVTDQRNAALDDLEWEKQCGRA